MRNLHSTLHLQHHRHTGRMLHHRHTSYHALVVIFVLAGAFMTWLHFAAQATAEEFGVQAMVLAPPPTGAPAISAPVEGQVLGKSSTLVDGVCPLATPQVVISVSVDKQFAGTSACDSSNDFAVPVSIGDGSHTITATVLTIDGRTGSSSSVDITGTAASTAKSVMLTATKSFLYTDTGQVTWTGSIGTGQDSQYVHIDWGDGSQDDHTVKAGPQSFSHTYQSVASHNILLSVADAKGAASSIQYGAAAYSVFTSPTVAATTRSPSASEIAGLYGLYLTALSVTGIVWLEARHAAKQEIW